jgi:AAA15 family ATPase/GTPase
VAANEKKDLKSGSSGKQLIYEQFLEVMRMNTADTLGFGNVTLTEVELTPFFKEKANHLESFSVGHFKKLSGLNLNDLGLVNLIAGINNSGKTSLLEAIQLICRQNNANSILEQTRRRAKIHGVIHPRWLFEQLPEKILLTGFSHGCDASVKFEKIVEDSFDDEGYIGTLQINSQFGEHSQSSTSNFFENKARETSYEGNRALARVAFSSPFSIQDPELLGRYYEAALEADAKEEIIQFIQQHIDPDIKDISLANKYNRFWVNHRKQSGDLTSQGEGLQRVFHIALQFAYARNGILLIDEFENGIHTELLKDFSIFVQKLAQKFNVQVFLTSHSKECINAFVQNGYAPEEVTAYALVEKEGQIACKRLKGPRLAELIELMDVDLRKAQ